MQKKNRGYEFSFSFGGSGADAQVSSTSTDATTTLTAADSAALVLQQDVRKAVREVYDFVVTA